MANILKILGTGGLSLIAAPDKDNEQPKPSAGSPAQPAAQS
jgi:hypothetical protein